MRKVEQQQDQQGFHLNLGEYWRVIWRKKYFIIVPLVISGIVSMVGVRFLVPVYESSSVIRIDNGSGVSQEVARFVQTEGRRTRDAEVLSRLEADLAGSAFLDELIRHLRMDQDPDLLRAAEEQRERLYPGFTTEELVFRRLRGFLKSRIKVDSEGPSLYRISYSDANREACFVLAETITSLYIDMQQRAKLEGLQEVSEFSEEQLAVYKERLERSERELQRFQKEVAQGSTTANPVTEANIGAAETINKDLDISLRTTENTVSRVEKRLRELIGYVPPTQKIASDVEMQQIENDLLSRSETELLRQLASAGNATAVTEVETDILAAQQRMQRYLSVKVATAFPDVKAEYRPLIAEYYYQLSERAALRRKQNLLDGYISAFRKNVSLGPHRDAELRRLEQEVEQNRILYNTFESSRTSTQISEAVQSTDLGENIVVVEAAGKPISPVRPDRMKILMLAVLFGMTVGGGGLLLTEVSDSSFRSVEDVERRLGLKVLGTVPKFDRTGRWTKEGARKRAVVWTATCVLVVGVALSGFYLYGKSSREQHIELNISQNGNR